MTCKRIIAILLCCLFPVFAAAQSTPAYLYWMPWGSWDDVVESPPAYFSGTYCRFSVKIELGAGMGYPLAARLYLNNELVKTVEQNTGSPLVWVTDIGLDSVFDSTHFIPGSSVTIRAEVDTTTAGTLSYTMNATVPVKNRALSYNHPDFLSVPGGTPSPIVASYLTDLYEVSETSATAWTPTDLFTDMEVCNFLYIMTHGNVDIHLAGNNDVVEPWDYTSGGITIPGYEDQRAIHIGSGAPPVNSTGNPPINLFLLEACLTGSSNNFIRACYPYINAYGEWLADQALLSYNVTVFANNGVQRATLLMNRLGAGDTLYTARAWLIANAEEDGIHCEDPVTHACRTLQCGDVTLYGDYATRITSVYTGDNVAPIGWYR